MRSLILAPIAPMPRAPPVAALLLSARKCNLAAPLRRAAKFDVGRRVYTYIVWQSGVL